MADKCPTCGVETSDLRSHFEKYHPVLMVVESVEERDGVEIASIRFVREEAPRA